MTRSILVLLILGASFGTQKGRDWNPTPASFAATVNAVAETPRDIANTIRQRPRVADVVRQTGARAEEGIRRELWRWRF